MTGSNVFTLPAEKLRQEIERLVERVGGLGEKALDTMGIKPAGGWCPPVDVIETPDEVVVLMDVPGISSAQLGVQIAGNMLTLTGSRGAVTGDVVHVADRPTGAFSRSVPMPVPVDHDRISASTHDGVLTVRLGRTAQSRSRTIPIAETPGRAEAVGDAVE